MSLYYYVLLLVALLRGCGDGSLTDDTLPISPINTAPSLNLDKSQTVNENTLVELAAVASDEDGTIVDIQWRQTDGMEVTLHQADTLTPNFISPELELSQTLTFEITIKDNEGKAATENVNVIVNPVITGTAVDEAIVNGRVKLISIPDLQVIAETTTDENGRYIFPQTEVLPERYLIVVSDGTLNGEPFLGEMEAICLDSEKASCDVTPISTLIKQYAEGKGEVASGIKSEWIAFIDEKLGVDFTNDPFIYPTTEKKQLLIDAIRDYVKKDGEQLENWENFVLKFLQSGEASDRVYTFFPYANAVLSVNAGIDQSVNEQTIVTLSGSSSDKNGAIAGYNWLQTAGMNVVLTNANSATASFTAATLTTAETLTFSLTVTDNEGASVSDSINIKVNPVNEIPLVNAGIDQSVNEQTVVMLSGFSSDSDGTIAGYNWLQTAGTNVVLTNANSTTASFTAATLTTAETLTFSLTVTDNEGASVIDTINIMVNPINTVPVASAGNQQVVNAGDTVSLIGAASNDSDGSIVSYVWVQIFGTTVSLTNANTATANFSTVGLSGGEILTFTLTVTDNEGATAVAIVNVLINQFPIANAGLDQNINVNDSVTLDATASSDDSYIANYAWQQTGGSTVTLSDENSEIVTFTSAGLILDENLTFELTVTDEQGLANTDSVTIAVDFTAQLNDTGITAYGNATENGLTEPVIGFAGQDAEYGRDAQATAGTLTKVGDGNAGFDFTKLDAEGKAVAADADEWACVQDNVTGLVWEVKTDDGGLQDKSYTYTWYNSTGDNDGGYAGTENGGICFESVNCDTEKYVMAVNDQTLCGANDWRLPNREELHSIVDYGSVDSAIDSTYFSNTQPLSYWTCSPFASLATSAWYVYFKNGNKYYYQKSLNAHVRLVRGGL